MELFSKQRSSRNRHFSSLRRSGGGGGPAGSRSSHSQTQPQQMALPRQIELAPLLPPRNSQQQLLQLPQSQNSRASSETSDSEQGPRCEKRREDRRRGRLNAELLTAILDGSVDEVLRSLDSGASVNSTCRPIRTTALHLAVACGHSDIVSLLMTKGADIQRRDRVGKQAVHLAAAVGDPSLLRLLLSADPRQVNSQVAAGSEVRDHESLDNWSHDHVTVAEKIPELSQGATPLHLATQRLYLDCVTLLLELGARVDLQDKRGLTPLDVMGEVPTKSSSSPLTDLADALPFSNNTLAGFKSMKQRMLSPRKPAARKTSNNREEKSSPSFLRIAQSEEPSVPSIQHRSVPFDPSVDLRPFSPSSASIAQMVANRLIDKGAKMPQSKVIVNQGGVQNQVAMSMTCLHTAVEHEDLQLVEFLLDNGACQLTWNSEGLTPLHLAVSKRLIEPLRVLLDKKKSIQVVDARDLLGRTPLLLAVAEEWFPGVSLLLEAGADVKATSNNNQTVLHLAAVKKESQLLDELLTIPESVKIIDSRNHLHETPLCCAVLAGLLSCVDILLSKGADITTSLPGDITLLHIAAERGNGAVLGRLLSDCRISIFKNVRTKEGKDGATALHLAALGGFVNCVELLITAGCDVYEVTSRHPYFGSTALHLSAMKGHIRVVESIIRHDRNTLNVKNGDGWYPLHVAARFSKKECVRFMLLNGANLGATVFDSEGSKKTAFDLIVYSILHPVVFLEKIFDRCIEVNEYPLNNPKCEIKVKYDILEPLGPDRKQLKVLDSLLKCGKHTVQEKLLLHPLVETFLFLKWKKLRVFFFLMMALYIVFTASLTTMAMAFYVLQSQSTIVNTCVETCRLTLCVSLILIAFQEFLQVTRMQRYYLRDLESWVKWSSFVLALLVAIGHHPADWLVHVSAVAVLLSWLELLFLLSRWPSSLGFYILMFFTVAKNVLRVLASFFFVILGFMFAFMIHFEARGQFDEWWKAFAKVMVMTIEFEYESMFENVEGVNAIVGRGIFLSFMVLVAIVLMNLLVGLAVSDIATLEKQGRAQRLAKQIDFLSMLEMFVYNRSLFACCPKKLFKAIRRCRSVDSDLKIEPGKPLQKTRQPLPHSMKQSVINNIIERKKKAEDDCCQDSDHSDDDSAESESISASSPMEGGDKVDKQSIDTHLDPQIRSSLQLIMTELRIIKQEIEMIKSHQGVSSIRPLEVPSDNGTGNQDSRVLFNLT